MPNFFHNPLKNVVRSIQGAVQMLPGNVKRNQAIMDQKVAAINESNAAVWGWEDRLAAQATEKTQLQTLQTMQETATQAKTMSKAVMDQPTNRQEIVNNVRDEKPNLAGLYKIKDEATNLTYGSGIKIPRYNTGT